MFLFGIFVFASLYLHWNLREYRNDDLMLVFTYVVLVALTVAPLGILQHRLSKEKEARIEQLANPGDIGTKKLGEVAKYVQDMTAVNNWHVSAVSIGILGNGILPLGFQFVVILLQSLGRAGKLPKMATTLLADATAMKGGKDAG
jgi:hypothetical protein